MTQLPADAGPSSHRPRLDASFLRTPQGNPQVLAPLVPTLGIDHDRQLGLAFYFA